MVRQVKTTIRETFDELLTALPNYQQETNLLVVEDNYVRLPDAGHAP